MLSTQFLSFFRYLEVFGASCVIIMTLQQQNMFNRQHFKKEEILLPLKQIKVVSNLLIKTVKQRDCSYKLPNCQKELKWKPNKIWGSQRWGEWVSEEGHGAWEMGELYALTPGLWVSQGASMPRMLPDSPWYCLVSRSGIRLAHPPCYTICCWRRRGWVRVRCVWLEVWHIFVYVRAVLVSDIKSVGVG